MLSPMKGDIEKTMTRAEQLIAAVQQSGFPHLDSLIHLFVGGSELHGADEPIRSRTSAKQWEGDGTTPFEICP
jgi:hypothetical protein